MKKDKNLYIIAGCNGAGKTTAFRMKLCSELNNPEFINPDRIAREIDPAHQWEARMSAGRETLRQIKLSIERGVSFCIETTLTSKSYTNMVRNAHAKGYLVHLFYYWLESAEASYRRVLQRSREGKNNKNVDNHSIPEDIIRRRYPRSVDNLFNLFIPIVDTWHVYDNNLGMALPIADSKHIYDPIMWDIIQRRDKPVTGINIDRLAEFGIKEFAETVLKDKLMRNESVVYAFEGRVEEFNPEDVLWLYENLQRNLEDWEVEHLRELSNLGLEQHYLNGKHFPASMILRLYGLSSSSKESRKHP